MLKMNKTRSSSLLKAERADNILDKRINDTIFLYKYMKYNEMRLYCRKLKVKYFSYEKARKTYENYLSQ